MNHQDQPGHPHGVPPGDPAYDGLLGRLSALQSACEVDCFTGTDFEGRVTAPMGTMWTARVRRGPRGTFEPGGESFEVSSVSMLEVLLMAVQMAQQKGWTPG